MIPAVVLRSSVGYFHVVVKAEEECAVGREAGYTAG